MFDDSRGTFRALLENDPPRFEDRVDTPWDQVPDHASYNEAAYNRILRGIRDLGRHSGGGAYAKSSGILILGEAGTGKTHLLMRAARELSGANHILFVRKPNNEDAVAQHVWANIVSSLTKPIPTGTRKTSQLDDLLAHVFSNVLIPEFERDIQDGRDVENRQRWVNLLKQDPCNLFRMLGDGERRQRHMEMIRRRTLRYLQRHDPDVDQDFARVLISYCFVLREDRKNVLLTWLSGQDVDEDEAKDLGISPTWVSVDETSTEASTQQQREEQALRAIRSLGILSTYYQPLILAFDQLEGLRGEERLTQRWGDVVRELFTMAPNMLIITCIFPSLWETWFETVLDRSAVERVGQQKVTLDTFAPYHATEMLAKILEPTFRKHRLPSSIFPFTEPDVQALCVNATSPRVFIQAIRDAFYRWLEGHVEVASVTLRDREVVVSLAAIDEVIKRTISSCESNQRNSYGHEIPIEQDLFGRIRSLTQVFLQESDQRIAYDRATCAHYVMPPTFIIRDKSKGDSLCVAIMNSKGNSFTARIRNLKRTVIESGQFRSLVILRDSRCRQIGPRAQEYLDDLKQGGAKFVHADVNDMVSLHALYDTLIAVEEHDLSVGSHKVDKREFVEYVRMHGLVRGIGIFREMASLSSAVAAVTASTTTSTGLPHAEVAGSIVPDTKESIRVIEARAVTPEVDPRTSKSVRPVAAMEKTKDHPLVQVLIGDDNIDAVHVGVLGQLRDGNQRLGLSLTKPQCIVLVGYMGSGKSYALGVLIENALLSTTNVVHQSRPMAVVAFNYRRNPEARFEYSGFAEANNQQDEVGRLFSEYHTQPTPLLITNVLAYQEELTRRQDEYDKLNVYPLQFTASELGAEHWEILMKPPNPSAEYMNVVRDIIHTLYYKERLSFKNLQQQLEKDRRLSENQRRQAMNRMSFAARWIVDERQYEWADILEEGSLSVVDLRIQTMQASEALKLCLITTDIVRRTRNGVNKMIIFDEAHEYVDCKELVDELENAITQIRHDGLSFVLASQIPERIPERIFRYLLTRFIFKLPHEKSINYVRKTAPNLELLARHAVANLGLEEGTCFVQTDDECTDTLLRTPQLLRVRPRCTLHSGTTQRNVDVLDVNLDDTPDSELVDLDAFADIKLDEV